MLNVIDYCVSFKYNTCFNVIFNLHMLQTDRANRQLSLTAYMICARCRTSTLHI